MIKSARQTVYELLLKMEKNAFSNIILDSVLTESKLSEQDKNFVSRLFYGVIERLITLDYIISLNISKPIKKIDKEIIIILRMGFYQLLFMDSVPDNASVNESVALTKQIQKASASGFVNAVLRNFIRNDKKYVLPKNVNTKLSIQYSCNEDIVKMLRDDYNDENVIDLLSASLETHTSYIRVNNTKISSENLIIEFEKNGISAELHDKIKDCLILNKFGSVENNICYKNGYFHVQDLSSQLCCMALNPQKGNSILDICSAPGGKSFTIAEIIENDGEIFACELHEKRVNLIRKGAERLNLSCIKAMQNDAKIYNEEFPQFDKILCDVPCSGIGVIRSKPEIKYTNLSDITKLPEIQYEILFTASKYLKIDGELVYSTCTVSKKENDFVIDKFLKENPDFEGVSFLEDLGEPFGDYKATVFPRHFASEGFFISKVRRIR